MKTKTLDRVAILGLLSIGWVLPMVFFAFPWL